MGKRAGAAGAAVVTAILILAVQVQSVELLVNRRAVNFNQGWRFAKGSQEGAEQPAFDDSAWQAVQLPHDWAISGPFSPREDGYAGKLPWRGEGWYLHARHGASRMESLSRLRRCHGVPKGLRERAISRTVGLRLHVLPGGRHAPHQIRRKERPGRLRGHAKPRDPLVCRGRYLPQGDHDHLRPRAHRPLEHGCDDPERGG